MNHAEALQMSVLPVAAGVIIVEELAVLGVPPKCSTLPSTTANVAAFQHVLVISLSLHPPEAADVHVFLFQGLCY